MGVQIIKTMRHKEKKGDREAEKRQRPYVRPINFQFLLSALPLDDLFFFKLNCVFFFYPPQSHEGYFMKCNDGLCQNNKQVSSEGTQP